MAGAFATIQAGLVLGGDFRIEELLGRGGMGSVYVVEQLSTGRKRALKLMSPTLVTDEKSRERFLQEARVGAKVESDHVVEVVAAGVDEATGIPWLAMELLAGEPFAETLSRRGALPRPEVREIFAQLGHALGAAHAQGLVHRDIKPDNVFLAEARRTGVPFTVKVLDFGLAKVLEAVSLRGSTTEAMGSPLWMAPEQTGKGKVLPATDVWALGLMAFQALSGHIYWKAANEKGGSLNALLVEIVVEPIELASIRAGRLGAAGLLPEGFDDWFARCVERRPELRFRDAGAAVAALSPLLEGPLDVAAAAAALAARPVEPKASPEEVALAETAPSGPTATAGALATARTEASGPTPTSPADAWSSGHVPMGASSATPAQRAGGGRKGLVAAVVALLLLVAAAAVGVGVLLGRGGEEGSSVAAARPALEGPPPEEPALRGPAAGSQDGGAAGDEDAAPPAPEGSEEAPTGGGSPRSTDRGPPAVRGAAGRGKRPPPDAPPEAPTSDANRAAVARFRASANECWREVPTFMADQQTLVLQVTVRRVPGTLTIALPPEVRGTSFARCVVSRGEIAGFQPTEDGGPLVLSVRVSR